jgi:hypothetical protein
MSDKTAQTDKRRDCRWGSKKAMQPISIYMPIYKTLREETGKPE